MRDLCDGAILGGSEWVSESFESLRMVAACVGVNERTVLAFVQEESVREGPGRGDSGEKREHSTGSSGGGMYMERCSLNLEV